MDYFKNSFHRNSCIFTREEIDKKRQQANDNAIKELKAHLFLDDLTAPLTIQEEALMTRFYLLKIQDVCRHFKFPITVGPVASWLLLRHSLTSSWMQVEAKHTMLACVLLASKCENLHLTLEQFANRVPNTKIELLVECEMKVLQAVEYQICFFQPIEVLGALLADLKIWCKQERDQTIMWDEQIVKKAVGFLNKFAASELVLLCTPFALATLALLQLDEQNLLIERYLQQRLSKLDHQIKVALENIDQSMATIADTRVDTELVKAIDRRLLTIRNKLKDNK